MGLVLDSGVLIAGREYLDTVFAAIPVELFTREMAQLAAKTDAEARQSAVPSRLQTC